MKRAVAAAVVAALVGAAAATGAAIRGTNGPDVLAGTLRPDRVAARGGNDRVAVQQGRRDRVSCGRGWDVATASRNDGIAADCEVVSRALSRDLQRSRFAQHETQVEPDSFSHGSTTVAVFQSGRYADGGATLIGFSTSRDGGRNWESGFLPGLTSYSPRPGVADRVSDPAVAYDEAHDVWLAASLVLAPSYTALAVSRSSDGVHWQAPSDAAHSPGSALGYDKEWIACDNWPGSPYRGRCYLSYTDVPGRQIVTRVSTDGGKTWSSAAGSPDEVRPDAVGAFPVIRPDGGMLVMFTDGVRIVYSASADGGGTFTAGRQLADISLRDVRGIRELPLPSADVAPDGTVYAVWHECGTRALCRGNDVVMSASADGTVWSKPARLPTGARPRGREYFLPALAADPDAPGRLAVSYYSTPACSCSTAAWLISSEDAGATWSSPVRLTSQGVRRRWIAETPAGSFLGDYVSVSFSEGRPIPVFSHATKPARGRLRQAIFGTTRGL